MVKHARRVLKRLVMQCFMALHQGDIVAIEQPVYLLGGEGEQLIGRRWPLEFLLGQRLVIGKRR